jgi:hypothetical protein
MDGASDGVLPSFDGIATVGRALLVRNPRVRLCGD